MIVSHTFPPHLTAIAAACLLAVAQAASAATIGIEAEDFDSEGGDGFSILEDGEASGGEYITTNGDTTGGGPDATVTYNIQFGETGEYYLYLRHLVPEDDPGGHDSFFAPDDFGDSPDWKSNNQLSNIGNGDWEWVNVDEFKDEQDQFDGGGPYTVSPDDLDSPLAFMLGGREDGLQIDGFVLSTESELSDEQLDTAMIPEPTTFALLLLGSVALLNRRPRRRPSK